MTIREQILAERPIVPDFILDEWLRTEFSLPSSISSLCEEFFLRVWDGSFVARRVIDGRLTTICDRFPQPQEFQVHWASSPALCKRSSEVACSFRRHGNKNYVIIKLWKLQDPLVGHKRNEEGNT